MVLRVIHNIFFFFFGLSFVEHLSRRHLGQLEFCIGSQRSPLGTISHAQIQRPFLFIGCCQGQQKLHRLEVRIFGLWKMGWFTSIRRPFDIIIIENYKEGLDEWWLISINSLSWHSQLMNQSLSKVEKRLEIDRFYRIGLKANNLSKKRPMHYVIAWGGKDDSTSFLESGRNPFVRVLRSSSLRPSRIIFVFLKTFAATGWEPLFFC